MKKKTRIELAVIALLGVLLAAEPAWAVTETISWTNPSDPSVTGINVQTAATAAGPFANINAAPLPPTQASLQRVVTLGQQDCVQVIWLNPLGPSAPLGPSCGTPNPAQRGTTLIQSYGP